MALIFNTVRFLHKLAPNFPHYALYRGAARDPVAGKEPLVAAVLGSI